MQKKRKSLVAFLVLALLVLHEIWLIWLFPRISLAAIAVIPFLFLVSIGAAVALYFLFNSLSRRMTALLIIGLIVVVTQFQIFLHPSTHESPYEEISKYWTIFRQYPDSIQYEDLAFGNDPETIAAAVKFEDEMPEKFLVVEVGDYPYGMTEYCYAEYRDGSFNYDTDKLLLSESGDDTLLVLDPGSADESYCYLGAGLTVLTEMHGSVVQGLSDGRSIYWEIRDINEQLHLTGAEVIFRFMIIHFR